MGDRVVFILFGEGLGWVVFGKVKCIFELVECVLGWEERFFDLVIVLELWGDGVFVYLRIIVRKRKCVIWD